MWRVSCVHDEGGTHAAAQPEPDDPFHRGVLESAHAAAQPEPAGEAKEEGQGGMLWPEVEEKEEEEAGSWALG